jgi:hypothetical protein
LLDYDSVSYEGSAESVRDWIDRFDAGPARMRKLGILRNGKRLEIQVPKGKLGVRLVDAELDGDGKQ